jgi:dienelactone hydrolase
VLGFADTAALPQNAQQKITWEKDGVVGELVTWSVGYGPPTEAWLLKPKGAGEPLPAVVALHDHGAVKFFGKEKIGEGVDAPSPYLLNLWKKYYGGRAFANALARAGFLVLAPDVFLWGSRRFPTTLMPEWASAAFSGINASPWAENDTPAEIGEYNFAASLHEHDVEKYCRVLGTTLAGVISYEDRVAANYLLTRPGVDSERIGCIGLSGGGARSALLNATHDRIKACVIVGMMSSYAGLLDAHIASHTWMFYPGDWPRFGDWPDLAACRAPSPLLVQYLLDDELFTRAGMTAAHERLQQHYHESGQPDAYRGEFYPGPHQFTVSMQESAFAWLHQMLA